MKHMTLLLYDIVCVCVSSIYLINKRTNSIKRTKSWLNGGYIEMDLYMVSKKQDAEIKLLN